MAGLQWAGVAVRTGLRARPCSRRRRRGSSARAPPRARLPRTPRRAQFRSAPRANRETARRARAVHARSRQREDCLSTARGVRRRARVAPAFCSGPCPLLRHRHLSGREPGGTRTRSASRGCRFPAHRCIEPRIGRLSSPTLVRTAKGSSTAVLHRLVTGERASFIVEYHCDECAQWEERRGGCDRRACRRCTRRWEACDRVRGCGVDATVAGGDPVVQAIVITW